MNEVGQKHQLEVIEKLREVFGQTRCREMFVIDKWLTFVFGHLMYDMNHFEEWCFKDGMKDDETMCKFLERKYGENASYLVGELFCVSN